MWEAIVIFEEFVDANGKSTFRQNRMRKTLFGSAISFVLVCSLSFGIFGFVDPVSDLTMFWPNVFVLDLGFVFQGHPYLGRFGTADGRISEPDISDFNPLALKMGFDPILCHVTFFESGHQYIPVIATRGCNPLKDTACVFSLDHLFVPSLFGQFPLFRV